MSLKPYREYKESGVEWLGDVPREWAVVALRRYVSFKNGRDYKQVEATSGGYPVIGSGGEFRRSTEYLYDGESVLFGRKGTIDKPLFVTGKFWTVDTMYYTTIDTEKLDPKFLYYWATLLPYDYYVTSTALPSMTQSDLGSARMALPRLQEQISIAKYLDHETAEIDAFVADQEGLIALLSERRAATITQAVTKGLDPAVPMKDSGVEWLNEIPTGWDSSKIKRAGTTHIGLTYTPEDIVDEGEGGTLVLRSGNVQNGQVDLTNRIYVKRPIPSSIRTRQGDILICARNGSRALIGKNAMIGPESVGKTFGAFMTVLRSPDARFLYWVLNSSLFQAQMGLFVTATINQLTNATLGNFEIPFPPDAERDQIANYLDRETAEIDAAIEDAREAIELMKERRAALISAAVTGKIDVRDHVSIGAEGAA